MSERTRQGAAVKGLFLVGVLLASLLLTHSQRGGVNTPHVVKDSHDAAPNLRAVPAPPRPRAASRSRRGLRGGSTRGTGTLTDTTCYLATGHRTASGLWPKVGMAASNHYPFGTKLHVEGVGVVTVRDRIGHGTALDLFFADRSACVQFGRRALRVRVVR